MPVDPPQTKPPQPEGTPDDVEIEWEPRKPETDSTLGIPVAIPEEPSKHPLVTIGDSISHGFQSLAIFRTDLSWPAVVARQLGLDATKFRFPTYEGHGGLPFNLERCARGLQAKFGHLDLAKDPLAVMWLLYFAQEVKHWWTHEADKHWDPPPEPELNHNLSVYSYDVQTSYSRTLGQIKAAIAEKPKGFLHLPITPHDVDRAARRVLVNAEDDWTLLDAARALGADGGIDTLVVELGANNVLDVVINLSYQWATSDEDRSHGHVWSPHLFDADWKELMARVTQIKAKRVIVATVPHVTVVPLFSRVGPRLRANSRYFKYYTHYWLADRFDPDRDPHLTGDQARAIDSAIDQYNDTIVATVRDARNRGLPWFVFEMAGLLDRLAWRRYLTNPASRPSWWDAVGGAYELPQPLKNLHPVPDTQFLTADRMGRTTGGLIALDGVHPTTVGYGVVAQEVIRVMQKAGVTFPNGTGDVDFDWLLSQDELTTDPPATLTGDLHIVGWLNEHLDIVKALLSNVRK